MTATDANAATSNATSLIKVVTGAPQIVSRNLFYNQSGTASPVRYDGNNSAINSLDDNAIALDKTAYIPGSGAATFANVSSYTKGINGIMVFQDYALFPWLSVRDNIGFGPASRGLAKAEVKATVDKFIELVGLQAFATAYPHQLSGGMAALE